MSGATFDLVVRAGRVVDGSGLPSFTADIGVSHGRIVKIGRIDDPAREVLDADGLVVTPGFIDIHTHYDAQLHWDPTASPASWHGVTTVLTGNCGFTIAPARPQDLPWLLQMLSRVEGMSADALAAGVTYEGGGFADFLAGLDGNIGVNVGANVGHCAIRRYVMGDEASERAATDDEIASMQKLVRAAMRAGAVGFTSSQLELHVAHDGRPVPSNLATRDELLALASVLADFDHGAIEFIPRSFLMGYDDDDRALIRDLARVSGKPIDINTLTRLPQSPDGWSRSLEFAEDAARDGLRIYPMYSANRMQPHFSFGNTFLFDEMPTWRSALTAADRLDRLRDPALRAQLRREMADPTGRSFVFTWDIVKVASVNDRIHDDWVGRTIADLAAELQADPLDVALDGALSESLDMVFSLAGPVSPKSLDAQATLMRSAVTLAGSSDGGAHLSSYCGADYPTRLLTQWVGEVFTFEEAVARLTSMPAHTHGIVDRGTIRVGAAADLCLIDRDKLDVGPMRWTTDFPAGAGRFVIDGLGYVATLVNGEVLMRHGVHTGATPGALL